MEEAGHLQDSKKQWEIRSACDPKLLKFSIAVLFTKIYLGTGSGLYSLIGSLVSNSLVLIFKQIIEYHVRFCGKRKLSDFLNSLGSSQLTGKWYLNAKE